MKKLAIALIVMAMLGAALAFAMEEVAVAPRQLAPYVERRAAGHRIIDELGASAAALMTSLDRGAGEPAALPPLRIGAQRTAAAPPLEGRKVDVATPAAALAAISQARPGDIVTFEPGTYRFSGRAYIPTSSAVGVTVRAARPGTVFLEFNMTEGFLVKAPYWTFENLDIRGVCSTHDACEHAFHVVNNATHFVSRNNTVTDFNAHFKINSSGAAPPDYGIIEHNTLTNSAVRNTSNPVTLIDLVAADGWTVRANLLADFVKGAGDAVSYGAFAKGAGTGNKFEGNMVLCEYRLRGAPGQRVGLSLGGGATGAAYCRDKQCRNEQDGGIIASNLIASCSDEGIYLNRAAASRIMHNTLIDTAGIMVRFTESSADVQGNLVDGRIAASKGARLRADDNLDTSLTRSYTGSHPLRSLFRASSAFDFTWSGSIPRRDTLLKPPPDLCGVARGSRAAYGAFEDFSACLRR